MVYLDWNATTPQHPDVLAAQEAARPLAWANPASVHKAGRAARRIQEDTREQLARALSVHPRDVLFTSGGTEANHLALSGATSLITSRLEHPSVAATADELARRGVPVEWLAVPSQGRLEPASIGEALARLTSSGRLGTRAIVAVQAANHETGVLQPLAEIAELVHTAGARLHVDAVQLLGRGDHPVLEVADSIAVASHKIRGPKGVGALAFRCDFQPIPLGRGGAQERGLRPGTQDAVALAGFGAALARLDDSRQAYRRASGLCRAMEEWLLARFGGTVAGQGAPRLGHISNWIASGGGPSMTGDELVAALDLEGICISSGSACSAGTAEPSPVIEAMLGREPARRAVRISLGESTDESDVAEFRAALERVLGQPAPNAS
ncbi:MAG TPA: aminotransferase class V-fold PLP-dependent enzyme [Polyangiaceae bacterium]|nr:aminotransferase class V-fold PLP-dependent enzyme [Polyangiaceae bacterium]